MSMDSAADARQREHVEATAGNPSRIAASVHSAGDVAQAGRVRERTNANYPIRSLVTSVPLEPAVEHADEFQAFAKYINTLRLTGQLGDGYILTTRRDEKIRQVVWRNASDASDATAEEVRRLQKLPPRVRRGIERLVAYCASGCELVTVYRTHHELLVYVGGTSISSGAGARLHAVRCRHGGYVFPSLSCILALTPRNGPRRTVDMATLQHR